MKKIIILCCFILIFGGLEYIVLCHKIDNFQKEMTKFISGEMEGNYHYNGVLDRLEQLDDTIRSMWIQGINPIKDVVVQGETVHKPTKDECIQLFNSLN